MRRTRRVCLGLSWLAPTLTLLAGATGVDIDEGRMSKPALSSASQHADLPETQRTVRDASGGLRLRRLIVATGVAVILLIWAIAGFAIWREHAQTVQSAHRELRNLAAALAEQHARTFQTVDLILRDAVVWVRNAEARRVTEGEVHDYLSQVISGVPQIRSLNVYATNGQRVYTSRSSDTPVINVVDRNYFIVHRDNANAGVYISEPSVSRIDGRLGFALSRRLADDVGQFRGVISARTQSAYFQQFYHSIDLGDGAAISLFRADGVVLARNPPLSETADPSRASDVPTQDSGSDQSLIAKSSIDDVTRIVEIQNVQGFPLFIAVGKDVDVVLKRWRDAAVTAAVIAAFLSLLIAFLVRWQVRELARREALLVARDSALEAAQAKSEFLANMSHEIRTPMTGIVGMIDLAMRGNIPPRQREFLNMASKSADSLLRLLNDIIDFARIEARKLSLEERTFSLRERVGDTMKLLAALAYEKGLDLRYRIEPGVPDALVGDGGRLCQVLINLVSNAIKFTRSGEIAVRVNMAARTEDRAVFHFAVSDPGVGIPEDKRNVIFEAFSQVEPAPNRPDHGAGLGLSIASRLVRMMGGSIWLKSEVGKGTTFHFTASFRVRAEFETGTLRVAMPLRDLPVLVVDDHEHDRQVMSTMLVECGLKPTVVDGGSAALAALEGVGSPFAIVLIDADMPAMGGFELARRLVEERHLAQTVIMMLSSHDRDDDMENCRRLGIRVWVRKPVKHSELLYAISLSLGYTRAASQRDRPSAVGTRRSLRILVAEDNPINQELIATLLRDQGCSVSVAANGNEAVAMVREQPFDVVLMDVQMPGMDGLEATAEIRRQEADRGGRLPIIALTAHTLTGDRERFIAAGMDAYVGKPIREEELRAAIEGAIGVTVSGKDESASTVRQTELWNQDAALDRVKGNQALLEKLVGLLIEQLPQLVARQRDAVAGGDYKGLELAAHTLRGSAASVAAASLEAAAQRLEELARRHADEPARVACEEVAQHAASLRSALVAFLASKPIAIQ